MDPVSRVPDLCKLQGGDARAQSARAPASEGEGGGVGGEAFVAAAPRAARAQRRGAQRLPVRLPDFCGRAHLSRLGPLGYACAPCLLSSSLLIASLLSSHTDLYVSSWHRINCFSERKVNEELRINRSLTCVSVLYKCCYLSRARNSCTSDESMIIKMHR